MEDTLHICQKKCSSFKLIVFQHFSFTSFFLYVYVSSFILTLNIPAVDRFDHQLLFLRLSQKFFPATYDETLCKFLLYTYEDSHNSFWSKILSREHVEYVKVAWAENVNFKDCNFRVLRGIFLGVSIKQKLLKIEKYQGRWPFFLDLSIFRVKKCKKRISHKN